MSEKIYVVLYRRDDWETTTVYKGVYKSFEEAYGSLKESFDNIVVSEPEYNCVTYDEIIKPRVLHSYTGESTSSCWGCPDEYDLLIIEEEL